MVSRKDSGTLHWLRGWWRDQIARCEVLCWRWLRHQASQRLSDDQGSDFTQWSSALQVQLQQQRKLHRPSKLMFRLMGRLDLEEPPLKSPLQIPEHWLDMVRFEYYHLTSTQSRSFVYIFIWLFWLFYCFQYFRISACLVCYSGLCNSNSQISVDLPEMINWRECWTFY